VKIALESNKDKKVNAAKLAQQHDHLIENMFREDLAIVKREDKLSRELAKYRYRSDKDSQDVRDTTLSEDYDESTFTYRKLMIKLSFEQLLHDLCYTQDFEMIYEFIKSFGAEIETALISVINKSSLKSNNYWLMAIIPKLKNLKVLKF